MLQVRQSLEQYELKEELKRHQNQLEESVNRRTIELTETNLSVRSDKWRSNVGIYRTIRGQPQLYPNSCLPIGIGGTLGPT